MMKTYFAVITESKCPVTNNISRDFIVLDNVRSITDLKLGFDVADALDNTQHLFNGERVMKVVCFLCDSAKNAMNRGFDILRLL